METNLLVKKAKQGDKDALVELIMLQNQEYYKLAYAFLNNKEEALDAMEDMIVILYERIDRLRKVDAFYNWSKTILVNCCRGRLRRKKRIILYDSLAEETEELKKNDFNQKEERLMLDAALAGLSHKHQEVIRLRYYLDLDYETSTFAVAQQR